MPKMKRTEVLLSGPNGAETENTAFKDDGVKVLATRDGFSQVEVANGMKDTGWVPSDAIDVEGTGVSPAGPFTADDFADLCVQEALTQANVNPHYLIGIAQLRSGLAATDQGVEIGPFRLTASDWTKVADAGFRTEEIGDWDIQVSAFALMVQRHVNNLGVDASPVALYKAQWPNAPADISAKLKAAFDQTATLEGDAERRVIGTAGQNAIGDPAAPSGKIDKGGKLAPLIAANGGRWSRMVIAADKINRIDIVANRLVANKARYQGISATTKVPWFIIAAIHEREKSNDINFLANIAQGDPWKIKSTHVPAGRGPFTSFEEAAVDALTKCHPYAAKWTNWSAGGAMTLLEQYNGLGYAFRGMPSPYVWSFTNQYSKGKFSPDHVFRPDLVDPQLGSAPLIKRMQNLDPSIVL